MEEVMSVWVFIVTCMGSEQIVILSTSYVFESLIHHLCGRGGHVRWLECVFVLCL